MVVSATPNTEQIVSEYLFVGKNVPRIDAREKVAGEAIFTTDIMLPGMLIGKIKRSPLPFARILSINTDKASRLPGIKTVITAQNIIQFAYGPIIADELPLADKYARYVCDGVAAVAAVDEDTAEEALDLINVEYEELTPVLDPEKAMEPGAPVVHPELAEVKQNIVHHIEFARGEGEAAFNHADLIMEDRFVTPPQHHAYLETQACVAQWHTSSDKLTMHLSHQAPFKVRIQLARALGISESQIRMIQPFIGGGFGGKVEMQSHLPVAAFLSRKTGRPVKIVYTREEDITAGRPRMTEIIDLKMGFKKDGTMVAKSAVVTADAGAYCGPAPVIVGVSVIRPDCVYRLPNVKVVANVVYTNKIPRTAFRGYGNTEMAWAMESMIDMAAYRLGIDPIELRLKNCSQKGDVTVHGWILNSCGLSDCIKLAADKSDWKNKKQKREKTHGIGVACQVHVSGNRAVHPLYEGSAAMVNIDRDGKAKVINGESEMGQGMLTVYLQIAAEELGMDIKDIDVLPFVDTAISPFGMGTYGSRGTLVGGNAVRLAARDAKGQLLRHAAEKLGIGVDDLEIKKSKFYAKGLLKELATVPEIAYDTVLRKLGGAPITGRGEYTVPDYVVYPDKNIYGNYSVGYAFSAQIAEVQVDPETGKVKVLNIWVGEDIGKAINPKMCEGQIEGGVAQGMGFALGENYYWDKGKILNSRFADYKIPLSGDMPKIHTILVESIEPGGPFGAKSVGEAAMNPTAVAIANAVYDAVGVRITDLPATSEKVYNRIKSL